jgi:hypothetical protein
MYGSVDGVVWSVGYLVVVEDKVTMDLFLMAMAVIDLVGTLGLVLKRTLDNMMERRVVLAAELRKYS